MSSPIIYRALVREDPDNPREINSNSLLEKKLSVKYINPRTTGMRRKELGMSAKNDRRDALLIAEMLSEKKFWRSVSQHKNTSCH